MQKKDISREDFFSSMGDDKILEQIKCGNNFALEFLINKYKNFVRSKAKTYFLIGADKEDIVQEGMIGLFKAIRDFNDEKSVSFRAFAEICITRQIITAIKTATRQKHMPLNSYISLNKPVFEEEGERALIETINNDRNSDPEYLFISKEELNGIEGKMNEILSPLELEVLYSYLNGSSYQEIAVTLDKPVKSIDNALQRVKKKLEKYLKQRK